MIGSITGPTGPVITKPLHKLLLHPRTSFRIKNAIIINKNKGLVVSKIVLMDRILGHQKPTLSSEDSTSFQDKKGEYQVNFFLPNLKQIQQRFKFYKVFQYNILTYQVNYHSFKPICFTANYVLMINILK